MISNSTNSTDDATIVYYQYVASQLQTVILIIMMILGTVGNALTIAVMALRPVGKKGARFHFTSLAVVDFILLYSGLLRVWLKHLKQFDIRLVSNWLCAANIYTVYCTVQLEAWIIVNITIGRFLAVWYPVIGRKWNSLKVAVSTVSGTAVIIVLFNCHLLFKRYILAENGIRYCGFDPGTDYYMFMIKIYPWLDLIISSLLPICLLFPANIAIVVKIRQTTKMAAAGSKKLAKINNVTAMLLTISVVFLISNLPMAVLLVIDGIEHEHGISQRENLVQAVRDLIFAIVTILQYVICSCSFYLFCLAAPGFRREFVLLFRLKKAPNSVQPTDMAIEMQERRRSTPS